MRRVLRIAAWGVLGLAVVLAGAFAVGIATGVGLCAVAFGRDLFDRLPR